MRLLDRYLFRELLAPLGYCLGAFLIFWISFDAFDRLPDFQEWKFHLRDVIEYYIAMTPGFLVMVLPISLLLALLYTLTDHARYNEITAIRAAGVSLWRLCAPYFAVGFIASLALFALNELCAPLGNEWAERIESRHVQKADSPDTKNDLHNFGFTNARGHRAWLIGEYHTDTAEMIRPQVNWVLPDNSIRRLYAERAIRTNGVWTFFDVKEYAQSNTTAELVPSLQTNILAMPEFNETPKEIQSEIKISGYLSLRKTSKAEIPLRDIFTYLRLKPDQSASDKAWLLTKLHGRLAAPWTCLVVVFIAIPFGTAPGRRNLFVGVAGGIFICLAYFVLQQVALPLGSSGYLPAWLAAWLPNFIFGAIGLCLMARVR